MARLQFSKFALVTLAIVSVLAPPARPDDKIPLGHSTVIIDTPRGPVRFAVEVASDDASRERGLMFRTRLPNDAGMLFEFPVARMESFWMKNTILSLDILFIRADGTISSVSASAKPYSEANINSIEPVRAVLEINGGRSAAMGIAAGQKVHNAFFRNGGVEK